MFTFHWSELLVLVVCGLILFFGLALLMLRRRNERLQDFLTPDEPDIEEEFFRVKQNPQKEQPEDAPIEEIVEGEPNETAKMPDNDAIQWGTDSEQLAHGVSE